MHTDTDTVPLKGHTCSTSHVVHENTVHTKTFCRSWPARSRAAFNPLVEQVLITDITIVPPQTSDRKHRVFVQRSHD